MPELRILHIIDSVERGGAETLLINTIEALSESYPDCKQYLVTSYSGGALLSRLPDRVQYFNLRFTRTNFTVKILKLRALIKKLKVDVVHSHLLHSTIIARLALPRGVKLVSTYHSVFYDPGLVDYARKELILDRLTYKRKYFTIFVSEAVQQNITAAVGIKENHKVLVNFAASSFVPSYKFNPAKTLKIIMVGNLNPVKNHELAIRAAARLKDLPVSIDIFGEGVLRPVLEALIKETGTNVSLKGASAMTSGILSGYDLFMMTSHHEGMPVSLLEAMQTGLPGLLNDLPMLKETAGDSAIYFSYDSEQSLVNNLENILENKSELGTLSATALERSKGFSAANYISSLMKIYKEK